MNWISCKDALPTEEGQYLLANKHSGGVYYHVASWSNNLYKVDKYDFYDKKKKSGFYKLDSEYGYIETSCSAWAKIEPYEGE